MRMMIERFWGLTVLSLSLAACGGASAGAGGKTATVKSTSSAPVSTPPPAVVPKPPAPTRPTARVLSLPGLEGVIGADADGLIRQFGAPRLDIIEDDARKLQWTGTSCVLDVYLYPPPHGGRATATYLDARTADGRDIDRAACVAALRAKP